MFAVALGIWENLPELREPNPSCRRMAESWLELRDRTEEQGSQGTGAWRGENRTAGLLGDPDRRITRKSPQEGEQGNVLPKVAENPRESNRFQWPQ